MIYKVTETEQVAALWKNWEESLVWGALQGVMGEIYAAAPGMEEAVKSSMIILGDFAYFTGEPSEELVQFKPDWCTQEFIILVPENEEWAQLIEQCYGEKSKRVSRYAIKKEPGIFDREELQNLADQVPAGYEVQLIDETLFRECLREEWSRDFVARYDSYEQYERIGLGVAVLKDGEMVAGVSSYSSFNDGIEIEIVTKEEHRRKGLATVCGARILLECMDRGWYPSWDAQNLWSVGLAEKLGYHYSHEYPAYEIRGYSQSRKFV